MIDSYWSSMNTAISYIWTSFCTCCIYWVFFQNSLRSTSTYFEIITFLFSLLFMEGFSFFLFFFFFWLFLNFELLNTHTFYHKNESNSFRKELSKVALLTSYTIWNARQKPAWGSENQPLLSAWFSFILALPSAFAGFIYEFLCLSPAVVVLYVFVCVYSHASKRALGSLLVLGLNVLPFVMHFALVVCNVWIKVDITLVIKHNGYLENLLVFQNSLSPSNLLPIPMHEQSELD